VTSVARAFFDNIVRLHGIPSSIISDRDPVFTNQFWNVLFQLASVKLNFPLAFHSQSDGQSEAVNKVITMYLMCLVGVILANGCSGCRGLSFATTRLSSHRYVRHHFECSTGATFRPCTHMCHGRIIFRPSTTSWSRGMSSL
jgi:hypothetical protein